VAGIEEAVARAVQLPGSPAQAAMSARALAFAAQHRGAAQRMAAQVLRLWRG
jgi:hypothetical protein